MITADQLLVHFIGDYLLQSDWMAIGKTQRWLPAVAHAFIYSLPFCLFKPSLSAWLIICTTHLLIDRFSLAKYICYIKNFLAPLGVNPPWSLCNKTGYLNERPIWLTTWLFIIADNVIHILINGLVLKYL